ncbi:hypothetical protein HDV02_003302, partial [Globomyces sp. JEL0801]
GKKLSKEELEQKKEYIGDNYRPEEDDATEKRWTKRETTEKAKPLRTVNDDVINKPLYYTYFKWIIRYRNLS